MIFSSIEFIFLFFPLVLILYFCGKRITYKNIILALSSLVFYYLCGGAGALALLGISIIWNYVCALLFEKRSPNRIKNAIFFTTIIVDISLLAIFKFKGSALDFFNKELNGIGNLALPGISFFTFQEISYIIDVYRGEKPQKNIINAILYISFFPQLIAGPIVRYADVEEMLYSRKTNLHDVNIGIKRFTKGLCKKILIADVLGELSDLVFNQSDYSSRSLLFMWLGAISYSLQLYYDFSGYSDIAIGLGRVFGFRYKENFLHPYSAYSITDFWKKWHVSLSSWFRDYVYIPLGGSRRSLIRNIFNLGIVWLLTGLWHGANWTFILWAVGYFSLVLMEKLLKRRFQDILKNSISISLIYRVFTLICIILLWVIFRSDSLMDAKLYLQSMFRFDSKLIDKAFIFQLQNYGVTLFVAVFLSFPVFQIRGWKRFRANQKFYIITDVIGQLILMVGFIIGVTFMLNNHYNPFLYFIF